jgi:hypothetical protein
MKWYFYLNYFIYRFYDNKWGKRDNSMLTALLTPCLLVHFNVFTVYTLYLFITDFWTIPQLPPNYKNIVITWLAFLAIVNYFILYHKKKYIKVFAEFKKNNDKYKRWNRSVRLYIIGSIIICLIVLIIADLRNHNFELYFLK